MTQNNSHQHWMQLAFEQAQLAEQQGEVPVGAILVHQQQLIAKAHNQTLQYNDITAHAEIQAIRQGCQHFNNHRLNECSLYITLEPCTMCAGAIIHARIKQVVFAAFDKRAGAAGSVFQILGDPRAYYHPQIITNCCQKQGEQLLQNFFKQKRLQQLKTPIKTT